MGTLFLVRHGQASFGAEDYDQLSPLGYRQATRLGQYWRGKGLIFDAALMGTLKRHSQTLTAICEGLHADQAEKAVRPDAFTTLKNTTRATAASLTKSPDINATTWPGLNEYDSEAVIAAIHPEPLERPTSPEMYRQHFRLLKDGLRAWMDGVTSPKGMPCYSAFVAGVTDVLTHVRTQYEGNILLVSSGGPIATAVGQVLGTAPETIIELNLRIRNSSVTEFAFTPKRHMLQTYNTLPHLDEDPYANWVTYS